MSKPIEIDLRRDLPKVREQLEAILPNMGYCLYASPCVVGALVPKGRRQALDRREWKGVSALLKQEVILAPRDQWEDLTDLQVAFDRANEEYFLATLARLEAKYLTGEVG